MISRDFAGEFNGTFIMVLFGCGSVAVAVLYGEHIGIFPIAILWGVAVTLAIYISRHISCAHFNPAVTLAMISSGRMKPRKITTYLIAQFSGSFTAAAVLYALFSSAIRQYETLHSIVRGEFASIQTAKMFGEYYIQPNKTLEVSLGNAIAGEAFGTFLLVLIIFLLTETCNVGKPDDKITPVFIGLSVSSIICLIAPLTQAGLNPARDFSPRLVALLFGWGKAAFPDNVGGFFWVYVLAPLLGGQLAALLFVKVLEPLMGKEKNICCE